MKPIYMLTVLPGLEPAAADEIKRKIHGTVYGLCRGKIYPIESVMSQWRGKVFFTVPETLAQPEVISALRSADNIYRFLFAAETSRTRDALSHYNEILAVDQMKVFIETVPQYCNGPTFTVNASVAGKHNYSRFEAADVFSTAMARLYNLKQGERNQRDMEFRLDIQDGCLLTAVKLTDASFRYRGTERIFQKAALRPTVAHALVWAAQPYDSEVFLDPFCGSGTILCERAAYTHRQIIGCDNSHTAAECSQLNLTVTLNNKETVNRRNASLAGKSFEAVHDKDSVPKGTVISEMYSPNAGACIMNIDMRRLPVPSHSINTIVTNPPWGGQIESADLYGLYKDFLYHANGWLKREGQIILLSPLEDIIAYAAAGVFSIEALYTVSLHGTLAKVYRLRKKQYGHFD